MFLCCVCLLHVLSFVFWCLGTETLGAKSESEGQTPDNSGASENSDNTVIFLPYSNNNSNNKEVNSEESNLNTKSVSKIEDKDLGEYSKFEIKKIDKTIKWMD